MPLRNLTLVLVTAILSFACYQKAQHNRYASSVVDAMRLVERYYVEAVDSRQLFENAMTGMVKGLDQYSQYIGPTDFQRMEEDLDQEFGGVGIEIVKRDDESPLIVLSPLVDTPAYRAGMRAGDTIDEIEGSPTAGMPRETCVTLMRGKPGSPVTLLVRHLNEPAPVELTIVREVILVQSVKGDLRRADGSWDYHLQENPRVGYLRLEQFGKHTVEELEEILGNAEQAPPLEALILDLRGNSGGLLSAAVQTCDAFIAKGPIVSTRGRDGQIRDKYSATASTMVPPDLPLAVLVNGTSASASEIVAACLQDHRRAVIIGQRTWGKGTVQNILEFEGGRSALKLTTTKYWRPSGKNIHRDQDAGEDEAWGVRPNAGFDIVLTDEQARALARQRARRDLYPGLLDEYPELLVELERPTPPDEINGGAPRDPAPQPPPSQPPPSQPPLESPPSEPPSQPPPPDGSHGAAPAGSATPPSPQAAADDEPLDDPQLRKAIQYIEQRLDGRGGKPRTV